DLDQLPARNDDFLAGSQSAKDDHGSSGAIVDGGGGFRAGQLAEPIANDVLARGAFAAFEVHFEVEVAAGGFAGGTGSGIGDGRAAEVGVQNDAGGVNNAAQVGAVIASETFGGAAGDFGSVGRLDRFLLEQFADAVEFLPHAFHHAFA